MASMNDLEKRVDSIENTQMSLKASIESQNKIISETLLRIELEQRSLSHIVSRINTYLEGDGLNVGIEKNLQQMLQDHLVFSPLKVERKEAVDYWKANKKPLKSLIEFWEMDKDSIKGVVKLFSNSKIVIAFFGFALPLFYAITNVLFTDLIAPYIHNLLGK